MKDLIALVADLDTEHALRGLLSRHAALGIRQIAFDIFRHPRRDPGCLLESADFLRGFFNQYERAIVMFDHEGCGREADSPEDLENRLAQHLRSSGWDDRAKPIVVVPELEIWVWSDSPQVDAILGWAGIQPPMRDWLRNEGWLGPNSLKPRRPKEALHAALRISKKVPSASLFEQLARTVSIRRCTDQKFQLLLNSLRIWFPQ